MNTARLPIWHLKKGSEKKFRLGHPWVFSSELAHSPKGLEPGSLVELRDHAGQFLARGYGHPNSLISFRTLSLDSSETIDADFFYSRVDRAAKLRRLSGLDGYSNRLVFAEGDGLPGLIVDQYPLAEGGLVFVVQSSTAGMEKLLPQVFQALERLASRSGSDELAKTSIVLANNSKSRVLEGMQVEPKRVVREGTGLKPESSRVLVQPGQEGLSALAYEVDFIHGQKTGFFLDQRHNVSLASRYVGALVREKSPGNDRLRVLDLCCYVGQWGAQLSHLAKHLGVQAEVTCVDASQSALDIAGRNVEAHGGLAKLFKRDVLDGFEGLERGGYDVVICDPPAFIKKKKDIPTGAQAYAKINREAIRRVSSGGFFVSCSCSGLFTEEDFRDMLAKVSGGLLVHGQSARWVARGGHSADHPQRPEFPQGTYLKAWMGFVD